MTRLRNFRYAQLALFNVIVALGLISATVPLRAEVVTIGQASESSNIPFGFIDFEGAVYATGWTYQQLYAGSAFPGAIKIEKIEFIRDISSLFPGEVSYSVDLFLSTAATAVVSPAGEFAANRGADRAAVFSGTAGSTSSDPTLTFDVTPYVYDPAAGDLLVEFIFTGLPSSSVDMSLGFMGGSDRRTSLVREDAFALFGGPPTPPVIEIARGLQTAFTVSAVPLPTSMALFASALVVPLVVARRRQRKGLISRA